MPYYVSSNANIAHNGKVFKFGEELTNVEKLAQGELEGLLQRGVVSEQQPQGVAAVHDPAAPLNPSALRPESGYAHPVTPGNLPQNDPFAASPANNHDAIEADDEANQRANEPQNFTPNEQQQPVQQPVQQPQQPSPADTEGI